MAICYKCAADIELDWKKCFNCKKLLLCPQCDNRITANWKKCPNCSIDLDYGRLRKYQAIGGTFTLGIIVPIFFLILGFLMPWLEVFSFNQLDLSVISTSTPSSLVFLVWNITLLIGGIIVGIYYISQCKGELKEMGFFSLMEGGFSLFSLLIIKMFAVFIIVVLVFALIYIMSIIETLRRYSKMKKNRPKYLEEKKEKEEKARLISNEAKKSLLGMIKSEGSVNLNFASQIIKMDQNNIRRLIYDLIAEDKVEGTFQENTFLITSDVNDFIDDLMNKYVEWEEEKKAKKV